MIRFRCPACKTVLRVPDSNAKLRADCPKCRQRMVVPLPSAHPRQPTAPAEPLPAVPRPQRFGLIAVVVVMLFFVGLMASGVVAAVALRHLVQPEIVAAAPSPPPPSPPATQPPRPVPQPQPPPAPSPIPEIQTKPPANAAPQTPALPEILPAPAVTESPKQPPPEPPKASDKPATAPPDSAELKTSRSLAELKKKIAAIEAAPKQDEDRAAAERSKGLRRLQVYRCLAGVPYEDMVLDADLNRQAEAAAKICEKLGKLDHNPANPGWLEDEYQFARKAAGSCTLSFGPRDYLESFAGWMADTEEFNLEHLGHRRWCLNPTLQKIGLAKSGIFYAMTCLDRSRKKVPDYDTVCWPPPGLMPVEFFAANLPWSVSPNPAKYRPPAKDVAVTVTAVDALDMPKGDALKLNVKKVSTSGMGTPLCVIFRPEGLRVEPGRRYRVEIEGLKTATGKDAPPMRYVVEFVSLK